MIRSWYVALEQQSAEPCSFEAIAARSPFDFSLTDGAVPGSGDLFDWVCELRSADPQVEFRLERMRTVADGEGVYRTRFNFDRRTFDASGRPHLARREQTWLVQDRADTRPQVLRIDDEPQIVFPGTGPQMVCN